MGVSQTVTLTARERDAETDPVESPTTRSKRISTYGGP